MGACCKVENTSSQEQTIVSREHKLEFYKYSIRKIKEKFFNLNSQNEISLEKVLIGLEFLGKKFSKIEKEHILIPFLKGFVEDEDTVEECFEYNFTNLMAVFFLLSNSSELEKGEALFRFYDTDKSNTLDKQEIEKMLGNLVKTIDISSNNILRHNQLYEVGSYQSKLIMDLISDEKRLEKKKIVETIVKKVIALLLEGDDMKQLNEKEFGEKLKQLKMTRNINLLSIPGIRKLISDTDLELKAFAKDKNIIS